MLPRLVLSEDQVTDLNDQLDKHLEACGDDLKDRLVKLDQEAVELIKSNDTAAKQLAWFSEHVVYAVVKNVDCITTAVTLLKQYYTPLHVNTDHLDGLLNDVNAYIDICKAQGIFYNYLVEYSISAQEILS